MNINRNSFGLAQSVLDDPSRLNVLSQEINGATVIDFGLNTTGGLEAGLQLAAMSCGGLAKLNLTHHQVGQRSFCAVQIQTDSAPECCIGAQYAGWPLQTDQFFAMGSGPLRAIRGKEPILTELGFTDSADHGVICLETSNLPTAEVIDLIVSETGLPAEQLLVAVAPTRSIAGSIQVVARSVETALHKLHELGFDLSQIISGVGIAPIPPIANDDLKGIGLTNDSILFAGQVDLWLSAEQSQIDEVGPLTPSSASQDYGTPFYELFKQNNFDFYKIDPKLFSPAKVTFHNLASGKSTTFGQLDAELLIKSFGL